MRFTQDGPIIPNDLLDARDSGDVVFLCGAGISIPAGLPDFFRLTADVAHRLGVQPDSPPGRLIEAEQQSRAGDNGTGHHEPVSFDRIFTLLVRTFGIVQVETEVAGALTAVRRPKLDHHRALLDLARGPDARQRLITTNFDRLFNKAQPRLRCYTAPQLPDLSRRDGFDGVVHLHGILPRTARHSGGDTLGLILSSGDFGRAYLADAWATRFVCDLLDRHIVVLLGYSADDPPMRYLLEGLSLSGRIGERRLYAFAAGDSAVVEAEWRERGVTAIAYDGADNHRHLWEAIHGWAARARDPAAWRNKIVSLAQQKQPQDLKPFERGQVAALCSSAEGAQLFTSVKPPPPAEWLCVLDAYCRYWEPGSALNYSEKPSPKIDPLAVYGLDDDPPRPPKNTRNQTLPGINLLAPLKTDDPIALEAGVIGQWRWHAAPLNSRLFDLSRWIQSVVASPTTVWWAASRGPLHGFVRDQLASTLEREETILDPVVQQAWRLVLEAHDVTPDGARDGWYGVSHAIRKYGWGTASLRVFASATQPRIAAKRSWFYAPVPPEPNDISLRRIAHFDIVYPKLMKNVAVPDEHLAAVIEVVRSHLELGGVLESEINDYNERLPTLYPEKKAGVHYNSDREQYYLTFAALFRRLAVFNAVAARREYLRWDSPARFFLPLRLMAQSQSAIVPAAEAGSALRCLSREDFWDPNLGRDLLWTIRTRWSELSVRNRKALESKILEGRERYEMEGDTEYAEHRASLSTGRLQWMKDSGLELTAATLAKLPKLKKANPRWRDSWAKTADESHESRTDWVKSETDPTPIVDLPVSEIITRCDALAEREFQSFTDCDPFRGLVETDPQRAMAVLNFEARRKNYPRRYWSRLLNGWPKAATPRRSALLAKALTKIPARALITVRYELCQWLGNHYEHLEQTDRKIAQACFDYVVTALEAGGREAVRSGLGKASVGGVEIPSNRMGVDYAINAPTGDLAQGLIRVLFGRKPKRRQGLAKDLRVRMERLLALPEEGGWHALTIIAEQLQGLYAIDPAWARATLLPRFDPVDSVAEAAWSGFLRASRLAHPVLFREMKSHFLAAIAATQYWHADGLPHLAQHLILALEGPPDGTALVTSAEGRIALRSGSAELRREALWFLRSRAADEKSWNRLVVPFFRSVWPRERQFQNAETTHTLVLFLEELGDKFPDGLKLVVDFLVTSPEIDLFVFQFNSEGERGHADLATRYPQETLLLLSKIIDETAQRSPYGLADVLTRLAEAAPELRHDERWQRLHRLAL